MWDPLLRRARLSNTHRETEREETVFPFLRTAGQGRWPDLWLQPAGAAPAAREGAGAGVGQRASTEGLSSDGGSLRKPGHEQQRLHAVGSGNEEV
jgi:hypothetical protein